MIRLQNISLSFGEQRVFESLSLEFPERGTVAVTAPSGRGKTSLLRIIAGLTKPDYGEVTGVPSRISYVFQEQRLLPWFSALENVRAVNTDRPKAEAEALLLELGISPELARKRPAELSGGQRQRVCIARALFYDGDILLLDEPFSGLDLKNRKDVMEKVREYAKNRLVIVVSHVHDDIKAADVNIEL